MSLVHPCAANLVWRELAGFLSDVPEKTHWFKQEDLVIQFCLAEGCDEKVGVRELQRPMHRRATARNADL